MGRPGGEPARDRTQWQPHDHRPGCSGTLLLYPGGDRQGRLHGWVQVDKTHRGVFVKIFCPQGQQNPRSSRTDWSRVQHVGPGELHPVDRKNSWSFTLEDYQITGRVLHVTGTLWKSPLWQDEILYFNHGGQAIPLQEGENSFNLLYVPGEDAYMGTKYSRYPGRRIKLTEGKK